MDPSRRPTLTVILLVTHTLVLTCVRAYPHMCISRGTPTFLTHPVPSNTPMQFLLHLSVFLHHTLVAFIASPLPGIKPNCSSVDYSSPNLQSMRYHLHAYIIPTIMNVPILFEDWYNHTVPPFVRGRAWWVGRAWSCVVVRGRAWTCVVVRGRSCEVVIRRSWSCVVVRGRAWSVVVGRARSCVVVRGRAWSCVVGRGRAPSRQTRSLQGTCAKPMIHCERASRCDVALRDVAKLRCDVTSLFAS